MSLHITGTYSAYFGYNNENPHNVHLAIGTNNHFLVNSERDDSFIAQGSLFRSGAYDYTIYFTLVLDTMAVLFELENQV